MDIKAPVRAAILKKYGKMAPVLISLAPAFLELAAAAAGKVVRGGAPPRGRGEGFDPVSIIASALEVLAAMQVLRTRKARIYLGIAVPLVVFALEGLAGMGRRRRPSIRVSTRRTA